MFQNIRRRNLIFLFPLRRSCDQSLLLYWGHTYRNIIILLEFHTMRNFQIINLFEQIQSMSHRSHIQILQSIMIQMHKDISCNLILYNQSVPKNPARTTYNKSYKTRLQLQGNGSLGGTLELLQILRQLHTLRQPIPHIIDLPLSHNALWYIRRNGRRLL